MEDLSLHILDIAENSITAGAENIEIKILEDTKKDILRIEIIDDGKGMTTEQTQKVTDPFYTSRTTRKVGLGLPLLKEAAKMANGTMNIKSEVGKGTHVSATFQLSNIDRQPVGNMADTIVTLVAGNPDRSIKYTHEQNGNKFIFDTKEIKERYPELDMNSVEALSFFRKCITENTENFSAI